MSNFDATQELWEIFLFIRTNWQSTDDVNFDQFESIVNYKTSLDSDYLGYYQQAVTEYENLYQQTGDKQMALGILYQQNQCVDAGGDSTCSSAKLPEVAKYVLWEFMQMNVAFGGFRDFGYENYQGWMGGGSYEQVPPPYRTYNGDEQS